MPRSGTRTASTSADPVNLVPLAAGIILAIGDGSLEIFNDFILTGIALGTIVVVGGYHLARVVARAAGTDYGEGSMIVGPGGADREPPAGNDR